jgi:cytochrome c553
MTGRAMLLFLLSFLVAPATVLAAWAHFDPSDTSKVPKTFSRTGFYSDWSKKTVTPEAAAFEVNAPLWSDNAVKSRWILLRSGSSKVGFDPDSDYYEYPDGAVFVKLFQHDTIPGDAASRIYWETRVLVNRKTLDPSTSKYHDLWYPFSYRWKPDGSEAYLVPAGGFDTSLAVREGRKRSFRKWSFPSVAACNACHRQYSTTATAQGRTVLGFFTPQLNRPAAADPKVNQIAQLFRKDILTWPEAPPSEAGISRMAKWARYDDESASLDLRARSYIAANCSGCHGARGRLTDAFGQATVLNFDYFRMSGNALAPEMELRDKEVVVYEEMPPIAVGDRTITQNLVVPGYPQLSTLLFRMRNRNRKAPTEADAFAKDERQMPPLGVFEVDTLATNMIARWIQSLPPLSIPRTSAHAGLQGAGIQVRGGELILLSRSDRSIGGAAELTGLDGRREILIPISGGRYRLPKGLPHGLYLIREGSLTYKLVY